MLISSVMLTRLTMVGIWAVGTYIAYYTIYGKSNGKVIIMSVAKVEKKYKKLNEANRDSMF